jgi:hypothetical protein
MKKNPACQGDTVLRYIKGSLTGILQSWAEFKKRRFLRISVLVIYQQYHPRTSLVDVGDRSLQPYIREMTAGMSLPIQRLLVETCRFLNDIFSKSVYLLLSYQQVVIFDIYTTFQLIIDKRTDHY